MRRPFGQVAQEIRRPVIAALARTSLRQTSNALPGLRSAAARARIHTFIATSDLHLERKLRMHARGLSRGRRGPSDLRDASPTMWSSRRRTQPAATWDFLCRVVEAVIEAGARPSTCRIRSAMRTPEETKNFSRSSSRGCRIHRAVFSTHCHDDLGLAVANSLAAVRGGVRQIECTVNGIGERAGNMHRSKSS